MCDYCEWINDEDMIAPTLFTINNNVLGCKITTEIWIEKNKIIVGTDGLENLGRKTKKINFCPMCGKKLMG